MRFGCKSNKNWFSDLAHTFLVSFSKDRDQPGLFGNSKISFCTHGTRFGGLKYFLPWAYQDGMENN